MRIDDMPGRIARLPRTNDNRNFPVPWFVAWIDGKPDFRIVGPGKIERAVRERLCWVCGGRLTRHMAFLIGPMCAVNRISSEPPCHTECAVYSALHCPFLTHPTMTRRGAGKPEEAAKPAGHMIERNPGVALVWVTRSYQLVSDGQGGVLFRIGDPAETRWFAEGRPATRAEVEASIESGLPILRQQAELDGKTALVALERMTEAATRYLPEPVQS